MRNQRQKEIALKILKITGMGVLFVAVSILAPQFPYLVLKYYLKRVFKEEYKPAQLRNSVNYLKRKKFIAYKNKQFILTKLGKKYLKKQKIKHLKINKVAWDRRWRIVTFDIPEDHAEERHILRRKLKNLGFFHFQRSVFIIPYPCEKEIDYLAVELNVSEHVHVLVADRFRNDRSIAKKFKLR